jgi:hypothetical protein
MKKNQKKSKRTIKGTPGNIKKIINLRKHGFSFREIATKLKMSKTYVNFLYNFNVNFNGQMCPGSNGQKAIFEIHNYQVVLRILEKPHRWKPNVILKHRGIKFTKAQRNGWIEYIFPYRTYSIHLTPHSVFIFPPKIESKISPVDAKVLASQMALDIVPILENKLEIKISNRRLIFMSVSRQHVAMKQDRIFDLFRKHGFQKVQDDKGVLRLKLDRSDNEKHIESEHFVYSEEDIGKLDDFLKEIVLDSFSLTEMRDAIQTNQKAIYDLQNLHLKSIVEIESNNKTFQNYIG